MSQFQEIYNKTLDERYFTWTHTSGLTVYVIPKKHSTSYAMFATRYGSVDVTFKTEKDTDYLTLPDGVAHFLEHKMFEDENGEDAFSRFALTGASANAYTSFGKTCYLFSCTELLEENLKILLDFVSHPFFSEKTIQKEQGIIGEEIAMYDDNPGWQVFNNLLCAMYRNNPIRNSITGNRDSIATITPEMLYRVTDTFYNLHNMVLIVCGDTTPEQIERICEATLPASSPEHTIERIVPEEPEEVQCASVEQPFAIAQPYVEIAFKDTPVADAYEQMRRAAANAITCQLLLGRSGSFYNRMYERGLINDKFGGGYVVERGAAFTEISACCNQPQALRDALCEEIEARQADYFTEEQFAIAKRVVYANHLFLFDSTEDVANTFLTCWIKGGDCFTYSELLSEITREEAWRIFRETVRTDRVCMSVLYPKTRKEV